MKFDLRVTGIKEVKRSMRKYSVEVNKKLQKEVARTAYAIQKDIKYNIAQRPNKYGSVMTNEGNLVARIFLTVGNLGAVVWAGAKYAEGLEKGGGGKGTWPDKDAMIRWVKRKIKPPKNKLLSVVFLVRRKIFKQGVEQQEFFAPAVIKHKQKFFNNVRRIILDGKDRF